MRLNIKHIGSILIVMTGAIGLVVMLSWSAISISNEKIGFTRNFIPVHLTLEKTGKKEKDIQELAGNTSSHLYFRTKEANKIGVMDLNLQLKPYIMLNSPNNYKISSRFISFVDSPYVDILAGNVPGLIKTQIAEDTVGFALLDKLFLRTTKISNSTYVFKGFDSTVRSADPIFYKWSPTKGVITREKSISEKRGDAGLSTDGVLLYDKKSSMLVYTHFYQNQILCMDTNLNLIHKMKTVDPTTIAQIQAEISSANIMTNTTPKRQINGASCVSNGILYNNSKIVADNEKPEDYNNGAIIDKYNVRTGSYEGSFYLPNYNNEGMRSFLVIDDSIIVLYKTFIASYRFNSKMKS